MFIDSDDRLSENVIESLLLLAYNENYKIIEELILVDCMLK